MTLGLSDRQGDLLDDSIRFCNQTLPATSIYAFLHRERDNLFPDEFFADLFAASGRRSVPPSVVAVVMVLQRLEGLSDREAVERFAFDTRWRYASGVGGYDGGGRWNFVHTVLVDMRERLRKSDRPNRIFEVTRETAAAAGLIGRHRVLDSTPLYDAVATMDTITLIRSALRGLLAVAERELEAELRAVCTSGDDYATSAKPQIDWDDFGARNALIDTRARDASACLALLDGRKVSEEVTKAAELLASVVGQDLETGEDGTLRIARRVARDRIISTVDPEARHGHKTVSRSFDGYKGHIASDPDSEIVTGTTVTAGNVGDAAEVDALLGDCLPAPPDPTEDDAEAKDVGVDEVFGDSAYGTGPVLDRFDQAGVTAMVKVQSPHAAKGQFTKDAFVIDLEAQTVTCPENVTANLRERKGGGAIVMFGAACTACPLLAHCTTSKNGRQIVVGPHEAQLSAAREVQRTPGWKARYRAIRPKVERKLANMMRRRHGGRRARVRGTQRVGHDFSLLGASTNLARLATLGVRSTPGGWATAGAA